MNESRHVAMERLQRWWSLPLLVILFFAVGLWLFFPAEALQQRLEQELTTRLQRPVSVGEIALQLPATLAISAIETTAAAKLSLQLTDLTLRPIWYRLFSDTPAAELSAKSLGGQLHIELDTANHVQFSAKNLHWDAPLPPVPSVIQRPTLHLQATIQQLHGSAFGAPRNQLEHLQLHLSTLRLSGLQQIGLAVDNLNLGSVQLQLSQDKQRLSIDQLTSRDGDLMVNGSGKIDLNRKLSRSRLDLTLTLAPSKSLDPAVSSLLPLFAKKQKDGRFIIRISGSLAAPQLR
ncbi:MAG: type II secretion system protein GspN [Desulfuromonas sp.]|nr:type II secretion system protein GspN [Desulfuromonas sp.]